jgi:hypothetical protein
MIAYGGVYVDVSCLIGTEPGSSENRNEQRSGKRGNRCDKAPPFHDATPAMFSATLNFPSAGLADALYAGDCCRLPA